MILRLLDLLKTNYRLVTFKESKSYELHFPKRKLAARCLFKPSIGPQMAAYPPTVPYPDQGQYPPPGQYQPPGKSVSILANLTNRLL